MAAGLGFEVDCEPDDLSPGAPPPASSGAGDASAANQVIGNTFLEQIESAVDGLETLIAATNAALATIDGHVDGIEGFVDGIETLIGTSNTTLTAIDGHVDGLEGSATTIASAVKLEDDAAANAHAGIPALVVRKDTPASTAADGDFHDMTVDSVGAQWVHPIQTSVRIEQDSVGVTTASTNYTSGDQVGTEMTFAASGSVSGWGGVIGGALLLDKSKKIDSGDFEIWLFDRSVTPAADNAAADFSDADMAHWVGTIRWVTADWVIQTTNSKNQKQGLSIPYMCNATSLFGYFRTLQANAFFSAAGDLRVMLNVLRD